MTVVALALGLLAGNIISPGAGFNGEPTRRSAAKRRRRSARPGDAGLVPFITDDLLPTRFVQPFVENEILQILVLAILIAAAISFLPSAAQARRRRLRDASVGSSSASSGSSCGPRRSARSAAWPTPSPSSARVAGQPRPAHGHLLGHVRALRLRLLGLVARLGGFSILRFIRLIRDELLIIVGTSSSETVLPRLLAKLEAAGASRQTVGMVIPTGYSFNLDGTCIYLTLGALFIVQASGQDMAIGEQLALAGADDPHLQGRRGDHRRRAGHADRVAAGVRRRVLHRRVDRRRHRARGRDRPHHERGPRADQLHRQRRRDDGDRQVAGRARRRALPGRAADPSLVDEATERALRGEDRRERGPTGGRFERERELVLPGR